MNFGTILNSVTKKCVRLMVEAKDDDAKVAASGFIKFVQIKEVLDAQFRVYHQLNSSYIKDKDSAWVFVNETLSMLDPFAFEDILAYNTLVETRFNVPKLRSTKIDISISKLVKYRTSNRKRNQDEYINAFENIVEHISTFRERKDPLSNLEESKANGELKFLQPKHVIRIALKKFNDRYTSKFSHEDRVIFGALREGNQKHLAMIYDEKIVELVGIANDSKKWVGGELSDKVFEALGHITTGYTQENLLDAHELLSEMRALRAEIFDDKIKLPRSI